jgi:hypothetical protein
MTDDVVLCDEAITSIIARLGFFRDPVPGSNEYRILVPVYLMRAMKFSPRSLQCIAEYDNQGDRLECGFRRVMHLRSSLGPNNIWGDVGLPFLDNCSIPFPTKKLENAYIFPKMMNNSLRTEEEAKKFMDAAHGETAPLQAGKTAFAPKLLPFLYSLLRIGQYYQPLPLSSSADAIIRASDRDVVNFQFKNFISHFSEALLEPEVEKSKADGWNTYLVIVCTAGHNIQVSGDGDVGRDGMLVMGAVTVVLLSKESVDQFLGNNCLQRLSGSSLRENSSTRIAFTPPKAAVDAATDRDMIAIAQGVSAIAVAEKN